MYGKTGSSNQITSVSVGKYIANEITALYDATISSGWHLHTDSHVIEKMLANPNITFADPLSSCNNANYITVYIATSSGSSNYSAGDRVEYAVSITLRTGDESRLVRNEENYGVIDIPNDGDKVEIEVFAHKVESSEMSYLWIQYVNIYRSVNNSDFYLWKRFSVDGEYDTTNRTACYDDEENAIPWQVGSTSDYNHTGSAYDLGGELTDSYTSLTGYYGSIFIRKYLSSDIIEEDVKWVYKWKVYTAVLSRGIIGNVRIGDTNYNDRIFVSPINKVYSFPENRYFLVGDEDGDEITAIEYLGNYKLAIFKKEHIYIINVSSTSEVNWSLVQKFNIGTYHSSSIVNTKYGLVFINKDGIYLLTHSLKLIELTTEIDWDSYYQLMDVVTAVYDEIEDMIYVGYQGGYVFCLSLKNNNAVSLRKHSSGSTTQYWMFYGVHADWKACYLIYDTSSPSGNHNVRSISVPDTSVISNAAELHTLPIRINRYSNIYITNIFLTIKGNNIYCDYTTDLYGELVSETLIGKVEDRARIVIPVGESCEFVRVAVKGFYELEEIAVEIDLIKSKAIYGASYIPIYKTDDSEDIVEGNPSQFISVPNFDPNAYYFHGIHNRTYICAMDKGGSGYGVQPLVFYVDHEDGTISSATGLGSYVSDAQDQHGHGALIVADDRRIVVVHEQLTGNGTSAHDSPLIVKKSVNPEDISSFETKVSALGDYNCFPKLFKVNGTLYIMVRYGSSSTDHYRVKLYKSTDNGNTWDSGTTIISLYDSSIPYWAYNMRLHTRDDDGLYICINMRDYDNYSSPAAKGYVKSYFLFSPAGEECGNVWYNLGRTFSKKKTTGGAITLSEMNNNCVISSMSNRNDITYITCGTKAYDGTIWLGELRGSYDYTTEITDYYLLKSDGTTWERKSFVDYDDSQILPDSHVLEDAIWGIFPYSKKIIDVVVSHTVDSKRELQIWRSINGGDNFFKLTDITSDSDYNNRYVAVGYPYPYMFVAATYPYDEFSTAWANIYYERK